MLVSFVLGALMIVCTPAVWRYDWMAVDLEPTSARADAIVVKRSDHSVERIEWRT